MPDAGSGAFQVRGGRLGVLQKVVVRAERDQRPGAGGGRPFAWRRVSGTRRTRDQQAISAESFSNLLASSTAPRKTPRVDPLAEMSSGMSQKAPSATGDSHLPSDDHVPQRPPTWAELQQRIRQLADARPDVCQMSTTGRSRQGQDLPLLTVRGGAVNVGVVAGAHANEPVGGATVLALAERVLSQPELREAVTWYLLPSSDPDGLLLTEPWFSSSWPPTMEAYHRGFYRPASQDLPEWTFPVQDGVSALLPETQAMMKFIDSVPMAALISLHGSDSGGSYTEPAGEDEWRPAGVSSVHYAALRHACLGVFPEVPMWRTKAINLPARQAAEHLRVAAIFLAGILERLDLEPHVPGATPYLPALQDTIKILKLMSQRAQDHPEQGADQDLNLLVPLRAGGMLLRHIDALLAHVPDHPGFKIERGLLEREFSSWLGEAEAALQPEPIPLATLVDYQIDTILGVAELVSKRA